MRSRFGIGAALVALAATLMLAPGALAAKKDKPLEVCKHGCKYRTIQKAVDASGKNDTINVKPGKYVEAVLVEGKKHNGLTIQGTKKNAKKVVLDGKGQNNNGIEGIDVKKLKLLNFTVHDYTANGVFLHECSDYLMKNLRADFNRSYGLFAFNCTGGRITKSVGYGHGDSAFYIGQTPPQENPKWTRLDHNEAYKNVLGYSGTNSKYVKIDHSDYYNNGVGIVPNTLDSEDFEPTEQGIIEKNNIFWNNFNYYAPGSPVQTVSNGLGQLGDQTINFPIGAGIVMLGADHWQVRENAIFGNFKWGSAAISDAIGNEGDDAISRNNEFTNNANGRSGTDTNQFDFFVDGSGSGNCFSGNNSSTFDPSDTATIEFLYPSCPAPAPPASGTGTSTGDPSQFGELAGYVLSDPPETMECSWVKHEHPKFKKFKPFEVGGVTCP